MNAQERVREDGLDYGLFEAVQVARRWLEESAPPPARVRVVGDDDSDGVSSAHVLAMALRRAGYEVDAALRAVHSERDVTAVLRGGFDAWVIADAGSAHLPALDAHGVPVLVLDHHRVTGHAARHVHEVNPRRVGGNRVRHVSASIVSTLFAVALDPKNWDLAYAGLAGAVSDRQHLGGLGGLVGYCLDGAVRAHTVALGEGFTLPGPTVLEAVAGSLDPYFVAYSGQPDAVQPLLAGRGIDSTADPLRLDPPHARALAEALTVELARQGTVTERVYPLWGERLALRHASGVSTVFALARLLEAATALDAPRLALRLLAGGSMALVECETIAQQRRRRILEELERLRNHPHEAARFRWVETLDESNTGVYAHALLTYVWGDDRPLVVLGGRGAHLKASARGSPRLLRAGLDLSVAVAEAAAAAGGNGGGHPGAAGASFPAGRRDEFLRALDGALAGLAPGGSA